eukprot:136048-Chlamydomonas_euryale.AAC.2
MLLWHGAARPQAIKQELVPRLVVFPPLRKAMSFQLPVTEAPVGYAHIAFANMVGVSMLQVGLEKMVHLNLLSPQLLFDFCHATQFACKSSVCMQVECLHASQ